MLHCLSQVFRYFPDFSGVKFYWRNNPAGLGSCIVHDFRFARAPFCFLWHWCTDALIEIIGLIFESPQSDYKLKEQARTDIGTCTWVQTSRNFIKQNLGLHLSKSVVLVTASPSILSGAVLWKTILDGVHRGVKTAGTLFLANFSVKGSVFLCVLVYLLGKPQQLSP